MGDIAVEEGGLPLEGMMMARGLGVYSAVYFIELLELQK